MTEHDNDVALDELKIGDFIVRNRLEDEWEIWVDEQKGRGHWMWLSPNVIQSWPKVAQRIDKTGDQD